MTKSFSEFANHVWAVAVIDAQNAQNNIADQMLKDPRIFGIVQNMLAKMVWKGFQQPSARS